MSTMEIQPKEESYSTSFAVKGAYLYIWNNLNAQLL